MIMRSVSALKLQEDKILAVNSKLKSLSFFDLWVSTAAHETALDD